jgi:hypothetical protein
MQGPIGKGVIRDETDGSASKMDGGEPVALEA